MVRREAGLEAPRDPVPMDVVWCKLPRPDFMRADLRLRAYLGHGHLLIAAPVYGDRLQVAWIIAKGSIGEIRRRGMPECLSRMADHVSPDLAEHLRRHRDEAVQPFLLSTVSDRVLEWTRPGLMVIGDAAHTMSPVGAQGLNIAVRDAVVAANHLVPVLSGDVTPDAVDAATRRVEAERVPEVSVVQRLQALPPRVFLRNTWWSRLTMRIVPTVLGPAVRLASGRALLRRAARGVKEVRLEV
jgi:2-polyprenyl-6-methoxyphenol hydroxylase-like FAD-dependent oxidoreductase